MVLFDNLENRIGTNVGFHRRVQGKSITDLAEGSGLTFEKISSIEDYTEKTVTGYEVKVLSSALKIDKDRLLDQFPHQDPSEHAEKAKVKQLAGLMFARCPENTNARLTGQANEKRNYGRMMARRLNQQKNR